MNRERVQMLRNMLAGIPEDKIVLELPFQVGSSDYPPRPCGAIACMAGWAWIYPPFIKAGIRRAGYPCMSAANKFFDVPSENFYERRSTEGGTDKQIALRRIDKLLKTGTQP